VRRAARLVPFGALAIAGSLTAQEVPAARRIPCDGRVVSDVVIAVYEPIFGGWEFGTSVNCATAFV